MIIEQVTFDKINILQRIAQKSFLDSFKEFNTKEDMDDYLTNKLSLEQLTLELSHPQSEFYMAKIDQQYIGYIKLNWGYAQKEFKEDNALEIERLYVLHEYHRKKVGQSLYNFAISFAKQKLMDYVWLGVWEHNQKAINFYRKNAFVAFDKHDFILGKDMQIDILMRKDIRNSLT